MTSNSIVNDITPNPPELTHVDLALVVPNHALLQQRGEAGAFLKSTSGRRN